MKEEKEIKLAILLSLITLSLITSIIGSVYPNWLVVILSLSVLVFSVITYILLLNDTETKKE